MRRNWARTSGSGREKGQGWLHVAVLLIMVAVFLYGKGVEAQESPDDWTRPFRLSAPGVKSSGATLASDPYGRIHAFWSELLPDERSVLQYAQYANGAWTASINLAQTGIGIPISSVAAAAGEDGTVHVMWSVAEGGPAYYSNAPARGSISAHNWLDPVRIWIPADEIKLVVDSKNRLHAIYADVYGREPGLYYIYSDEPLRGWSKPQWLDPDIPVGFAPDRLVFITDEEDGLHIVWNYLSLREATGDWVRYMHSLDGGSSWARPVTIDRDETGSGKLRAPGPLMAIVGSEVHVVWGADVAGIRRHHRYSTDGGESWTPATQVFGSLNGQAGDSVAVDGSGRVHFLGQIRYPQGIYHSVWSGQQWTDPRLVYLVTRDVDEPIGDRIHAHRIEAIVRNGNELLMTFTDPPAEPGSKLYVMQHRLEDVTPIKPAPTPTATAGPPSGPELTATPQADVTAVPVEPANGEDSPFNQGAAAQVWIGAIPGLVIVAAAILIQWTRRR